MRKLLLIITIGLETYALRLWLTCQKLQDQFHIDPLRIRLQIEDITHAERNIPFILIRMFDNKVVGYSVEITRQYLHFWDPTFLVTLLTISGMIGIFFGLFYFFSQKKVRYVALTLIIIILVQLIELLFPRASYLLVLLILWAGYVTLSLFGFWQFTREKKPYRLWVWGFIALVSIICLTLFQNLVLAYCAK
jgi:hypothetical protein